MAHGITLKMREIKRPEPQVVVEHQPDGYAKNNGGHKVWRRTARTPFVNPDRDRSLSGKARRRDRKRARRLARVPFFKGHGVASENAFNLRYDCACGFGIISPFDDVDFMVDVMEHEGGHDLEAVS